MQKFLEKKDKIVKRSEIDQISDYNWRKITLFLAQNCPKISLKLAENYSIYGPKLT